MEHFSKFERQNHELGTWNRSHKPGNPISLLTFFTCLLLVQVTGGQVIGLRTKNNPDTYIRMVHPNELILTIFDLYPYDIPDPIAVGPESAVTYMFLELHTNQEDWNMKSKLAQCYKAEFVKQGVNLTCTMPWTQHFYEEPIHIVCNLCRHTFK